MAEQPDYTQAGEMYRKTMEEAMANLDRINDTLKLEQVKAIDLQIAAQDEFKRIQREAHQISEAYMEKHRKEYLQEMRNDIWLDVTKKLILNEVPSDMLSKWLELPPQILSDAWFAIGFEKFGDLHVAHVGYEQQGRAGTVIFYRNDLTLHFSFEFAAKNTLAYIDVPTPENWEKETRLPLTDRMPVLEFVAKRIIHDQAPNCAFRITDKTIDILH